MFSINLGGLSMLYLREVRRFLVVVSQTVLAPVVTMLLFWTIFHFSIGKDRADIYPGVSFGVFLVPGLSMMAMVQNAFANTSSSLLIGKLQKNIVDTLMAPLTPFELTLGYAMGGLTRGILVGTVCVVTMAFLGMVEIHNLIVIILWAVLSCMMLSLLGVIGGIYSIKFDHLSAFTNFVITPLSFLSGTFYSITYLPHFGQVIAKFNPFFYMIDGFRYGFIGHHDGNLWLGFWILLFADSFLFFIAYRMFRTGYRLKS